MVNIGMMSPMIVQCISITTDVPSIVPVRSNVAVGQVVVAVLPVQIVPSELNAAMIGVLDNEVYVVCWLCPISTFDVLTGREFVKLEFNVSSLVFT